MATSDRPLPSMEVTRWNGVGKRVLAWAVPIVALAMMALMLVPAEVWRSPANDAAYQGFDPNLIFVSAKGDAPSEGVVRVSPQALHLTALRDSQPTVHLVTTPLSFRAAMTLRILESGAATVPFSIGIWSARAGSGYFLTFGPAPDYLVTAHTRVNGTAAQGLSGGEVVKSEILGRYAPGQLYHLEIVIDKKAGVIYSLLSGRDAPPNGGAMVRLVGGPADPGYSEVISTPAAVEAGRPYRFGGLVRLVAGEDAYKIAVQWLDREQNTLGFANDWRSVRELQAWMPVEFSAIAPPRAAFARVLLGSGDSTQLLFAGIFLREAGKPERNALANGDFRRGTDGWEVAGRPSRPPEILTAHPGVLESSVTVDEVPVLFASLRLSLTASAASRAGIARALLENYRLILPHQRWQVAKVDDPRARHLVAALLVLGTLLCFGRVRAWGRTLWDDAAAGRMRPLVVPLSLGSVGIAGVLIAYAIANALLFNLGSHPFDMTAAKVWAYVAATRGPFELYYLPHTVSLAKVWGGGPYHEAVFPYHPVVAYYVTMIGWVYRTFLSGPGPLVPDTFQLEFLIKSFNVAFGLADAVVIYLIVRELKLPRASALAAGAVFLLNPAIWFSMSVWGQNHVVTLFPILLSILAAERHRSPLAWMALAAGALTRPQMLVPAFLLGVVYFRKFTLEENASAIAWTIVVAFLALAPFSLSLAPSHAVDILANQVLVQEVGRNEPAMTIISLDAYTLWSLITRLTGAATGLGRFQLPSTESLIGALSYQRLSQLLVALVVLGTSLGLWLRRRTADAPGGYLPLLALGTAGFLLLKTGLAASHFIIGLPFLILCRQMMGTGYYPIVGMWTVTTLVSMYGSVGFAIWNAASLAPALHDANNGLTRLVMNLHSADWFITLAATANIVAVVGLAYAALRGVPTADPPATDTTQMERTAA